MTKKVFPIINDSACLLKWAWSTVFLRQGTTSSCHRTDQYLIPIDEFETFHNLPQKIKAREIMREGKWPQGGCQYCEKIEAAGGISDRLCQLETSGTSELTPDELVVDTNTNLVVPTILEVYFNNTCNMSCIYCSSKFSSKWEEENRKFGVYSNKGFSTGSDLTQLDIHYNKMVAGLWKYLDTDGRYKKLRQFQVAGGEPFFQAEIEQCLEFWDTHPNPDLSFNIITNMKVPHGKFRGYIDRLSKLAEDKKIKHVQISSSLDCWGPEQEYIRWGLNLKEWEQNFEYLLDKPFVVQCVNSAINALSIKTMPELLRRLVEWDKKTVNNRGVYFSFSSVSPPQTTTPSIIGPGVFESEFAEMAGIMLQSERYSGILRTHLVSIGKQISSTPRNHDMISNLKDYLTELDRRRGTDWPSLFPWLANLD